MSIDPRRRKSEDFVSRPSNNIDNEKRGNSQDTGLYSKYLVSIILICGILGFLGYTILSNINNRVLESDRIIAEIQSKMEIVTKERESLNNQIKKHFENQNASAEQIINYQKEIKQVQSRVDELSKELRNALSKNLELSKVVRKIDGEIENSRKDIERLANSAYKVTILCWSLNCNSKLKKYKTVIIDELGFREGRIALFRNTKNNAVFYYDSSAKAKADIVAKAVSKLAEEKIIAIKGFGKNVTDEERPTSIIVWIN